jgi:hypothetical protein
VEQSVVTKGVIILRLTHSTGIKEALIYLRDIELGHEAESAASVIMFILKVSNELAPTEEF